MPRRVPLACLCCLLWLGSTVAAALVFERQPQQRQQQLFAEFDAAHLPGLEALSGAISMIHVIDPECSCSDATVAHVAALRAASPDVRHRVITPQGEAWQSIEALSPDLAGLLTIPASPAVMLLDGEGGLVYFGPYSGGAHCGQGRDFAALALLALQQDIQPGLRRVIATGCHCAWSVPPAKPV